MVASSARESFAVAYLYLKRVMRNGCTSFLLALFEGRFGI